MDALVIAGGIPTEEDPLFPYSQGKPKSLIDVAGKPMAQWVLEALGGAKRVDQVVLIGLDASAGLTCKKQLDFIPTQGGMLDNILAGLKRLSELHPDQTHALVASADIPAITPAMVDWRVEQALESGADLDYVAVDRSVMETRFPNSARSYLNLKGHQLCGGDINAVALRLVDKQDLWERFIAARKSPLKQASLVGFDTLLLILIRQLNIQGAERMVSKRLGIKARVHLAPYAELAMDVDKPHQLEILRQDLADKALQS